MAFEVVMPKWGLSMQEGLIVQWLKQEGDSVEKDEPLLEVETEKMVSVVESPASGILARILQPAESRVPVSQAIALIAAPGESAADIHAPGPSVPAAADQPVPPESAAGPETDRSPEPPGEARAPAPTAAPTGVIPAMPAARRLAREHGLDLTGIRGTGPGGAITRKDVEQALTPANTPISKASFFSEGHRLDGLLYTPGGLAPGDKRAAVVLCAGFTYLKSLVMPDLARVLNAAGYIALIFDYRGFGDSEGPRWRLLPHEQVGDVRAALTYLAGQPQVDPERLALLGVSLGGSNAIVAGAQDHRATAVVAIEPIGDGERWLRSLRPHWEWLEFEKRLTEDRVRRTETGESMRVDPLDIAAPDPDSREFLESVYGEYPQMRCDLPLETAEALIEFRPEEQVERLASRPLLLIHGADDRQVAADESRHLFARAGAPRHLEIVPGMGHFDWVAGGSHGFRRVADRAVDFLREHLPPGA